MKISELKQPNKRMAEYLATQNCIQEASDGIYNFYKQGGVMDLFCNAIDKGHNPPITTKIKQNFPPDFDFSGEEVVNTNPFSVDGLSLNQIAMRIFRKNFMDLELWEQGLVNETFEQNVIAKNSIIELPNNLIIQNRIYTQLAKEGKFDELPDTCEFSEPVNLRVWDNELMEPINTNVLGKFKGLYITQANLCWKYAKTITKIK